MDKWVNHACKVRWRGNRQKIDEIKGNCLVFFEWYWRTFRMDELKGWFLLWITGKFWEKLFKRIFFWWVIEDFNCIFVIEIEIYFVVGRWVDDINLYCVIFNDFYWAVFGSKKSFLLNLIF